MDPVAVRFVGHSTVLLELEGRRILTDPFLRDRLGPLERHGALPDAAEIGAVDLVLISHGHPDHFDRRSLAALEGLPTAIVPNGLGPTIRRWFDGEVVELRAGESTQVRGVPIEAIRAKHWITPGAPRARPLGYVLGASTTVWFAGDTGRYRGISELRGRVDLALLPVATWGPHRGPGHLGPEDAAAVAADIEARAAVPIHWGTLYPRRLHRVWTAPLVEPGDRFAAAVARRAPGTDVRVLRPGDAAVVGP